MYRFLHLFWSLLLLGDVTASEVAMYKLHHRIPPAEFSLRASVTLRNENGVQKTLYQSEKDKGASLTVGTEEKYYQIALERPSDTSPDDWSFVSAKAVSWKLLYTRPEKRFSFNPLL